MKELAEFFYSIDFPNSITLRAMTVWMKKVCVYLPAAFHNFQIMFALKVTVQLPFGSINKLTLRTLHAT